MTKEEARKIWELNKDKLSFGFRLAVEVLMGETEKNGENSPEKVEKIGNKTRRKFGERLNVFRSLEVGDRTDVTLRDEKDWNGWRSTATYLLQTYGTLFTVRIRPDDRSRLTITRVK